MKQISMSVAALISGTAAINREPLLTWAPTPPKKDHPVDYFVPHFGEDKEITSTKNNIAAAEKKFGIQIDTSAPPKDPPRNYFVPNFGEDKEITYTKKNIADAEKRFGVKIDTSDPAKDPPRNYFVPNFGVDSDIKASLKNLADQEKRMGKWTYPESEWY